MKILSIETSCDDTGVTIMEATGGITSASFRVLADASNSQIQSHIPYGGVYPALAKREHAKNLPILLGQVLKEAKLDKKQKPTSRRRASASRVGPVDLITVTYGPGLEMCLWEGITFAKNLGKKWGVPIMPTDHMEGHICSVFGKVKKNPATEQARNGASKKVTSKFSIPKLKMPLLSLLVSGGHTQLIVSKKWMQYEIIGETLDDAVGEAYDKVARMLGLPYPGGPEISKMADLARIRAVEKQSLWADEPRDSATRARVDSDPRKIGFSIAQEKAESLQGLFPISLPRPMLKSKNFNFSYSGLKTAVLYLIRDLGGLEKLSEETKQDIALEFETAAIEVLIYKTEKAIEQYEIKTLVVGGGVSCNAHLRKELEKLTKIKKMKLLMPQKELTGDNSIMIAIAGYLEYIKNKKKVPKPETIKADGNVKL